MNLEDSLAAFAANASRTGIFCDFDGSLAEITPDPPDARAIRGASKALERLARKFAVVAVISGRPVSFLARRLHARHVRMVGLYGIEERIGRSLRVLPEVQAARARVERTAERLEQDLTVFDGVWVENKGLAVSVHYRNARDPQATLAKTEPIVTAIALDEGLAPLTRGRMVLEVAPTAVDKGAVVLALIEEKGLTAAFAAGDDIGDIPIFEAIAGLPLFLRVVVRSSEVPAELLRLADHVVDGPEELLRLLKRLRDADR